MNKTHTKFVETINDEDVGDDDLGIGKLRLTCHN